MIPIQDAPAQILKLSTEASATQIVVHCSGRLVMQNCEQFRQTVRGLISTTKHLVVDLRDVTHIDSSALGTLVGVYLSSKRANCHLKLINAKPLVAQLLSRWPEDAFERQMVIAADQVVSMAH